MRLESALYSSREGLSVHGQAISVVGDNISNANTVGFKTSRVEFADLLEIGSGVQMQRVRNIHESGLVESTGRALDVAIEGNGFFVIGDAANPAYSRAGNFSMRADGVLVNSNGQSVLGISGDGTTLGEINLLNINGGAGEATTEASIAGNLDARSAVTVAPANPATFLDLGQATSFIGALTVFDSLGTAHDISMAYTKTGLNTWTAQAYIDGGEVGGTPGQPVQIGNNATVTFNTSGVIEEANQGAAQITGAPAYSNGAAAGNFIIDLSTMTQQSITSQLTGLSQNGASKGSVENYRFDGDGEIYAVLDTGTELLLGRLQLATMGNPDSLNRTGQNLFAATPDTTAITIGNAGEGSFGEIAGSSLERSTTDLAGAFVELVLYQRGYQANSQTLSAANELIRDTIGLIR